MAASFDKLIQEIGTRYCIGPKACPLVQETLGLINAGFLDRFKARRFRRRGCLLVRWNRDCAPFGTRGRGDARLRRY